MTKPISLKISQFAIPLLWLVTSIALIVGIGDIQSHPIERDCVPSPEEDCGNMYRSIGILFAKSLFLWVSFVTVFSMLAIVFRNRVVSYINLFNLLSSTIAISAYVVSDMPRLNAGIFMLLIFASLVFAFANRRALLYTRALSA